MDVLAKDQIWKYVGESERSRDKLYVIVEILPAVKKPSFDWHKGIRYVPLKPEDGAPNDYTRFEEDFLGCMRYIGDMP